MPFRVPIPVEGYYREVLEGVASRFKAPSATSSLSRGTYADKMFIYESSHAEFEITLCDLEWSDLFDAALHQQMSKLGFEGYNLLKPPETSPNPPTPQLGPPSWK